MKGFRTGEGPPCRTGLAGPGDYDYKIQTKKAYKVRASRKAKAVEPGVQETGAPDHLSGISSRSSMEMDPADVGTTSLGREHLHEKHTPVSAGADFSGSQFENAAAFPSHPKLRQAMA